MNPSFSVVELYTAADGRAQFREYPVHLGQGSALAQLSEVIKVPGIQFRHSPVGFRFPFHCSLKPQWVFILTGEMEIGLQNGSTRIFKPGQHFLSADTLPEGTSFDASIHGHWSRQVGDEELVTLFVKTD